MRVNSLKKVLIEKIDETTDEQVLKLFIAF